MIGRISLILDCFTDGTQSLTLTGICERTRLAKSTASRIVAELVEYGYLERMGSSLALGIRVFELGQQAARPRSLKLMAQPRMAELRRATGSTVHLAVLEETTVVYIEILASSASPGLPSRVGGRLSAYATGVGKAMLAYADPELVERVIARGLTRLGPHTITDPQRLREELRAVRDAGMATEQQESGEGISCVAAPVFGRGRDRPVAAVSVSGWSDRLDLAAAIPLVRKVAGALSDGVRELPAFASGDAAGR